VRRAVASELRARKAGQATDLAKAPAGLLRANSSIGVELSTTHPGFSSVSDRGLVVRVRPCTHQDQGSQGQLSPRAPGTHRCPRKSLVPGRVQKCVTPSQTLWFSQPKTGTSAEQARGLGVLEKLHRGTGQGLSPIRPVDWLPALHRDHSPTDVSVQTPRRRAARSNRPVPACGPVP
jgi:hypothetical protein